MPLTCNHTGCDGATGIEDTTERDDGDVVVEEYECEFGHTFHVTIPAAGADEVKL